MKLYRHSRSAQRHLKDSVVVLGNFDGVHLAHQALLQKTVELARRHHAPSVLYTLSPHPAKVLAPHLAPPLITTEEQKRTLLERMGLDAVVVESFNRRFARMRPEDFFRRILVGRLKASHLVVGADFTFGHGRTGHVQLLQALGRRQRVETHILGPILLGEVIVSSTQIRHAVTNGAVDLAHRLLGRPFQLVGRVVRGTGTGARIGFKTANLAPDNELIPAHGVYATRTIVGPRSYVSVTHIGVRPTFGPARNATIETHIPGFNRSLLSQRIAIDFLKRLRDEKKFKDPKALKAQIRRDLNKILSVC